MCEADDAGGEQSDQTRPNILDLRHQANTITRGQLLLGVRPKVLCRIIMVFTPNFSKASLLTIVARVYAFHSISVM